MASNSEQKLQSKGIIPTAMRLLVLDYFGRHQGAVTLLELEKHFHWADRTTLFRTLKTFEKKGLLHSIVEGMSTKYFICEEQCDENHHHDKHLHFHCLQCKETVCLTEVNFSEVQLPSDMKFETFRFLAEGYCSKCQTKLNSY